MSQVVSEKIGVKSIMIMRAEGPSKLCGVKHYFNSWREANRFLWEYNSSYPGMNEGYDKHDFTVIFDDGLEWSGRLDVKQSSVPDNDQDIRMHIRDFAEFQSGQFCPAWMSLHDYQRCLQGVNRQDYINFLQKYNV